MNLNTKKGTQRFTQKVKLKNKLSVKVVLGVAGGVVLISAFIRLMTLGIIMKPGTAEAATCESGYTLDWGDPSTYTITCGSVNSGNWSVKGETCLYYSPVFPVGGPLGGTPRTVDIAVRINQSGNLDDNDSAWVYYYINSVLTYTDIYRGAGSPAVFTSARTITVPSAGTYYVSIMLMNDKANELWQVKNGDVTFCLNALPLPVTLTDFSAKADKDNKVSLTWSTISEKNNDYFTVERSADGLEFSELAQVDGAGSSTMLMDYVAKDEHPLNGTSYYRLRQTDFDGKDEIFKTVSIEISDKETETPLVIEKVFPNPFNESLTVLYTVKENAQVSFEFFDENSSFLIAVKQDAVKGENKLEINMFSKQMRQKIYYMRCVRDGNILPGITKVVKK